MSTTPSDIKILHEWTVTIQEMVDEPVKATLADGQVIQTTQKVPKPVEVRMGLRDLSRAERRAAQLFHDSRIAYYHRDCNLLLASEVTNRLINTTGGVLTDKEKSRVEQLRARAVEIDMDIVRAGDNTDQRKKLQDELASIRGELINLNAINEQVYASTAEANAQKDLNDWVTYQTIVIRKDGKWQPFFEGQGATPAETFAKREAAMWRLDEAKDPVYEAAVQKIAAVTFWFNRGASTPEQFKLMEEEMAKQLEVVKEKMPEAAPTIDTDTLVAAEPLVNEVIT